MSPSDHRARAREALRGNWPTAVLVTLVAACFGGLSDTGASFALQLDPLREFVSAGSPDRFSPLFSILMSLSLPLVLGGAFLTSLVGLLIGGAAHVGLCRYHLKLHDRKDARFSDLLFAADRFGSVLCMHVLRGLLILAGTMLLVAPGIVLAFGLSQAGWILAEDRECSASEALRRSWQLMRGHKMHLFFLELSFLGWLILSAMTAGIGMLLLAPYRYSARASFYRRLTAAAPSGAAREQASPEFSGKTYL